jgi:Tfp pilus assembly protein PilN
MPQQINLCTAALTQPRQRFQAQSLVSLLAVSLVAMGALGTFWLWSLEGSAQTYRQTLDAQASEIHNLQGVIQSSRAAAGPVDADMLRQLQDLRTRLQERDKLLQLARQGLFKAGQGHSDRLQLLARSIPPDAWVESLKADSASFEVSGFTLEPAVLNDWVVRLGQHPLMQGLKLNAVNVKYVAESGASAASGGPSGLRSKPMWSFSLVSSEPVAPGPVTGSVTGSVAGKP